MGEESEGIGKASQGHSTSVGGEDSCGEGWVLDRSRRSKVFLGKQRLEFRFACNIEVKKMAKKGAAGSAGRWGDDAWEEQNWDSVRKQEQMKQEVLIKASGNSERIRQMVRETEVTRSIGSETLQVLDQQSGEIQVKRAQIRRRLVWGGQNDAKKLPA